MNSFTNVSGLSRRDLLKGGACALAGASGLGRVADSFDSHEANSIQRPFSFHASQRALDDLRFRLKNTRFPERATLPGWSEGVPLASLRALLEYWRSEYNWRRCESTLNGFPQYRTTIDGLGIHFIHVRSLRSDALPLIITHGWPGSVIEFFGIIGPLTNPTAHGGRAEDAFHVVAPSLPGFAFSDKPAERGWNADRIARAWAELIRRLGYSQYVAQGGDWGAWVTTRLAQQHPPGLLGIHLNLPLVVPDPMPADTLSAEEQRAADSLQGFRNDGFGYFDEQATRPQTVSYALADSPSGQAAWIYEQFQAHTDNNGDPESALTRDQMLDDITLYWLTNTAASSARIYYENANLGPNGGIVNLPVGCSIFPREIYRAPRSWAEQCYPKLIYWNELNRGGHFAAFEQPMLFTEELRACFRSLRKSALSALAPVALIAEKGSNMTKKEIIRKYYAGWEKKEWTAVDSLLAEGFTFTSPNDDDHIDKHSFHAKCWPEAEWVDRFQLETVFDGDNDASVKYLCHTKRRTSFRNVEYFRFEGGMISSIECYFGAQHGCPSKSAENPQPAITQDAPAVGRQ
jgi:pimeloyl-ACP methyl ester carboxylesterase